MAAISVVPFVLAIVLYSLTTTQYVAFSVFLVALLCACLLYALMSRFRISLEVQAPSRVTEGESVDLSLVLTSRGRLPRFVSESIAEIAEPQALGDGGRRSRGRRYKFFYRPGPGAAAPGARCLHGFHGDAPPLPAAGAAAAGRR